MNCSSCGKEIRPDSVFCHHCGAKIDPNKDWSRRFERVWIITNSIGLAAGLEAAWLIDQAVFGRSGFFSPSALGWAVVGLLLGITQFYALWLFDYPLSKWWIFVTMVALPVGITLSIPLTFIVGLFVGGLTGNTSNDIGSSLALTGCMAGFTAAFVGGGIVGIAQSVFLKRRTVVTRQWAISNMFGWAIAGAIFGAIQLWLSVGLRLHQNENAVWLIILPPVGAIGGAISGKITMPVIANQIKSARDPAC